MFDPKAYKDEWTSAQKPQASTNNTNDASTNTATAVGDIKIEDKKDDFRHFDGTKAEVGGDVVERYNGLDLEHKTATGKKDGVIEDEIDDIIKPKLPDSREEAKSDELGIKALSMAEPTYDDFKKPEVEETEPEAKDSDTEVKAIKTDSNELEDLLASKANTAINNLKSKRNEKQDQITKLNREIDSIDDKIKELDSLTEDLKDKLKQFESEID